MTRRFELTPPPWASLSDPPGMPAAWEGHLQRIDARLGEGRLRDAAVYAGSDAAELLWQVFADFPADEIGRALAVAWTMSHAPRAQLSHRRWVRMFRAAGYVTDGPPPLVEPMVVYRVAETWTCGRGMAWTTSLDVARVFYARLAERTGAALYQTVAAPLMVLARFDCREECEVVVNPFALRQIDVIEV